MLMRAQAEIGRVLVPQGDRRGLRLLDEKRAGPDQNIGADHRFHRVQDRGMGDDAMRPGQFYMQLVAGRPVDFRQLAAHVGLIGFQVRPCPTRMFRADPRQWKLEPVMAVRRDLFRRQHIGHDMPPGKDDEDGYYRGGKRGKASPVSPGTGIFPHQPDRRGYTSGTNLTLGAHV